MFIGTTCSRPAVEAIEAGASGSGHQGCSSPIECFEGPPPPVSTRQGWTDSVTPVGDSTDAKAVTAATASDGGEGREDVEMGVQGNDASKDRPLSDSKARGSASKYQHDDGGSKGVGVAGCGPTCALL